MNIFKNIHPRLLFVLKIIGFSLLAIVVLAVLLGILRSSSFSMDVQRSPGFGGVGGVFPTSSYNTVGMGESADSYSPRGRAEESVSVDAEEFEITDYSASIESRNIEEACGVISGLKPLSHVIFESAIESDQSCHYVFKVESAHVSDVLAVIEDLNPKNLSETTRTIARVLEDFTSQRDILEQKIEAIDETLSGALAAYEEVTALASRTDNAESLARIITGRIEIIERLTSERLKLAGQMETLLRNQAEALERVDHAQFSVHITEKKYFDGEALADSWREALRTFFDKANDSLMGLTIGLVMFVLGLLPFILYAFVLIITTKYGIRFVRYIWKL